MPNGYSRRKLLLTSAAIGSPLLAGCTELLGDEDPTETPTPEAAPGIRVRDASLAETELLENESTLLVVEVVNEGDAPGEAVISVVINETIVDTVSRELDAGESVDLEFTVAPESTGTQAVLVNDDLVADVVVKTERPDIVRTVGAHYYPWYGVPAHSWRGGEWSLESPSTPLLGDYHSTDFDVIEQHIDWCRQAGITWLNVSWWGPGSHEDDRFQNDLLEHPRANELDWSVLYETVGQLDEWPVNMDDEEMRDQFQADLSYLADNYFDREVYKEIDGKPVLYLYVGGALQGDVKGAYNEAVEAADVRPYLIADIGETWTLDAAPITEVADAVTTYNPYASREDIEEIFLDRTESAYRAWYLAQEHIDVMVMPTTIPGFNDSEITHVQRDNPVLESSPDRYERTSEVTRKYAKGPVFVTSFNEWYEDTQIEPSEEHGEEYLQITATVLATGEREQPEIEGETLTLEFEKTVPESELNPDVENGRELTLLIYELTLYDEVNSEVVSVDVGGEEEGTLFLLGASGQEQSNDRTWRWLAGSRRSTIHLPEVPDSGTLEISGRGAAEMTVDLEVDGEVLGEGTVDADRGTYLIEYE